MQRAHRGFASPWWDFSPGVCRGFFCPCGHGRVAGADRLRYTRHHEADMIEFILLVVVSLLLIGIFVRREVFK